MGQLHLHVFPFPVLGDHFFLEALVNDFEALDLGLLRRGAEEGIRKEGAWIQ